MYTAILDDWKIEDNYGSFRLKGTIAGKDRSGRFRDGEVITTSSLVYIDFERMEARTQNSFYKLT